MSEIDLLIIYIYLTPLNVINRMNHLICSTCYASKSDLTIQNCPPPPKKILVKSFS